MTTKTTDLRGEPETEETPNTNQEGHCTTGPPPTPTHPHRSFSQPSRQPLAPWTCVSASNARYHTSSPPNAPPRTAGITSPTTALSGTNSETYSTHGPPSHPSPRASGSAPQSNPWGTPASLTPSAVACVSTNPPSSFESRTLRPRSSGPHARDAPPEPGMAPKYAPNATRPSTLNAWLSMTANPPTSAHGAVHCAPGSRTHPQPSE